MGSGRSRVRHRVALAWFSLVLSAAAPVAAGPPRLDAAVAAARAAGKPLVVEFRAEWCGACDRLDRVIDGSPELASALARVQLVRYDIDHAPGLEVASQFEVVAVPVLLVLDRDGQERLRQTGLPAPLNVASIEAFLTRAEQVVTDQAEVSAALASAAPGDPRPLVRAARWYLAHHQPGKALDFYDRALRADPEDRAGQAAAAAWERMELAESVERRTRTVERAVAYVTRYPAGEHAAIALGRAILSGDLSRERMAELAAVHIAAIAGQASRLRAAARLALAAGLLDQARAAVDAIDPNSKELRDLIVRAEVLHQCGDRELALAAIERAMKVATSERSKSMCRVMRDQIERGDLGSKLTTELQRQADRFYARIEAPTIGVVERRPPSQDRGAAAVFYRQVERTFREAARECLGSRHRPAAVAVRLELGGADEPPSRVVVLDRVGRELRTCLERKLGEYRLPEAPLVHHGSYTGEVELAPWIVPSGRERRKSDAAIRDRPTGARTGSRLEHSYLYLQAAAGIRDELGVGGRSLFRLGRVGDFQAVAGLRVEWAQGGDGPSSYLARATVGLDAGRSSAGFFVVAGVGTSRIGDRVPAALEIPFALGWRVATPQVSGLVWAGTAFAVDESVRQEQSYSLLGGDEVELGFGVRLPARSHRGLFVGGTFRAVMEARSVALLIGVPIEALLPR